MEQLPPRLSGFDPHKPMLFHYTTYPGFVGILNSRQLWATSVYHMNDSHEYVHGMGIAIRVVGKHHDTLEGRAKKLAFAILQYLPNFSEGNICTASFSENGDVLSQWRAYGGSGGISLGFSFDALQKIGSRNGFELIKCIYDEGTKSAIAEEWFERSVTRLESQSDPDNEIDNIALWFCNRIQQWACAFKHSGFREENEWRIISRFLPYDRPEMHVRATNRMLTPYFALPLEVGKDGDKFDIGIDEVVIGPTDHRSLIGKGVDVAFKNTVWKARTWSHTPYRTF
ncbi:DUF2971 domain-containing protein [Rhizobium herbae]|uniref:DUF2971 domain-containing protein n=1 Tax=Rhizobium herbae TaxID=508661 RepID=A0ABS4EV03_9HYPH|nr:DUF2971 domain-containing protein [Rhizobium herbae]MBP1861762.1 hypothetical protein [Rhizobium herbae]